MKLFVTPSLDANTITTGLTPLTKFLEKETGYYFVSAVPTSYITVVEGFGTNKVDIAFMNSFGYLLANEKYGAEALLRIVRYGMETSYRGQIVARSNSGINKLSDLENKSFAFVDPSSASGFILPFVKLQKENIKLKDYTFAMKHDNVITMVYQNQVDAGATYYSPFNAEANQVGDARGRVMTQFPDVLEKIKIVALTDSIPNDPFVFRKDIDPKMKKKIVEAFLKFASTSEGKKILFEISDIAGLIETRDKDYDILREMLKSTGKSTKEMVK